MQSGCQIYIKGSIEAVALYVKAFNLTLGIVDQYEDGTYRHVSLMSGENEIVAIGEDCHYDRHADGYTGGKLPNVAFNVHSLGTKEAVDHAYAVLSENARYNSNPEGPESPDWDENNAEYWFGLVDKFGIYWGVGM